MRLKAYILAADPAWIEASVLSYYDIVEEIVVSYDQDGLGWTGVPIAVDVCLERLRAIDKDSKMRYVPGHYARLDYQPMENETFQRQCALDAASEGADWVLQLDTDEIIADKNAFLSSVESAAQQEYTAVDYPARWLYCSIGKDRYLEWCNRFWKLSAGYPGPLAVRAGTTLRHARQCDSSLFRVDFRTISTSTAHAKNVSIHHVVQPDQGVFHYSMVREEEELKMKFSSWGHANDKNWNPEFNRWIWSKRHPYIAALVSQFSRGKSKRPLRIIRAPKIRTTMTFDAV